MIIYIIHETKIFVSTKMKNNRRTWRNFSLILNSKQNPVVPISLSLAKTSSYDVVNKLIVEGLYVVFSILRYFRKQLLKIKTMRGKKRVFMVQDGDYQGGGNKPEGVKKRQMHCLFFRIFFVGV